MPKLTSAYETICSDIELSLTHILKYADPEDLKKLNEIIRFGIERAAKLPACEDMQA
jgi:hypothetical protein